MPNCEDEIKRFTESVIEAGLPVEIENASNFAETLLGKNPPKGMVSKLVLPARFVNKQTFEQDFDRLAEKCQALLNDRPYAVLLSEKDKSDYWIYSQLFVILIR